MFKVAFNLCINFFICFKLSTCTNVCENKHRAYNDRTLDNLVFNDDYFLHERQGTKSLLECSLFCKDFIDCMSFCFKSIHEVCRLHSTGFYNRSDGVAEEGWKYYAYGDQSCPVNEGFVHVRSSNLCIHPSPMSSSYTDARDYCSSKNSKVISLDTSTKSDAFVLLLQKHNYGDIFIGLRKFDGKWTWENDKELGSESKWRQGQPYCPSGSCLCVSALSSWDWFWNDTPCSTTNNFFCEVEQE